MYALSKDAVKRARGSFHVLPIRDPHTLKMKRHTAVTVRDRDYKGRKFDSLVAIKQKDIKSWTWIRPDFRK